MSRYGVHGDSGIQPEDWGRVSFSHVGQPQTPATRRLVAAFEQDRSWPRVVVASFNVIGLTPSMATWLAEAHRADLYPYVSRLLRARALTDALPAFAVAEVGRTDFVQPPFNEMGPSSLAGSIAEVLSAGGAYHDGPPLAQSFAITQGWVDELIDDRYLNLRIAHSEGAWADWFYDVLSPWDQTWLITDIHHMRATLLCVTDTD